MSRDGYQPDFDIDLAYGKQGELWVKNVVLGATNGRTEVKRDAVSQRTGNLYVEYECRKQAGWDKSGIATTKADYYAFVIGDSGVAIFFDAEVLRELARQQYRNPRNRREETDGSHPTKGVLVPLSAVLSFIRNNREKAS